MQAGSMLASLARAYISAVEAAEEDAIAIQIAQQLQAGTPFVQLVRL